MPGHWERSASAAGDDDGGSVSFADVVRTSPPDIGTVVVSTYSLNMYVRAAADALYSVALDASGVICSL